MTMDADSIHARKSFDSLTAVILAGGLGLRLRPRVSDRPKVIAEVGGRPFLTYLLDHLAEAGIRKVVLCTGYQSAAVVNSLGDTHVDMCLVYSVESECLGTAGALRHVASSRTGAPVRA